MLTAACKQELPNPHRNCVREILNALICHDNDYRRLNVEIRNLQTEFKSEMDKIEFRCAELRRPVKCESSESIENFARHIRTIDEVNECFTAKIEHLKTRREETLKNGRECYRELNAQKCKLKKFHEATVDHLKRRAIKSFDLEEIQNCEVDICEMNRMFVIEVTFIQKCEKVLKPFFQKLNDCEFNFNCDCCCLKNYEWLPTGKSFHIVQEIGEEIKSTMGPTLTQLFAQMHVLKPPDPKAYLAAYLTHMDHIEAQMKEKMRLFEGNIE